MAHVDINLNFMVHLEITDKEKEQYLGNDTELSIEAQDAWTTRAEVALQKQLTTYNNNVDIDADYSIGEIF